MNLRQALKLANKEYGVSNDKYIILFGDEQYEIYDRENSNVYFADEDLIYDIIGKDSVKKNWHVRNTSN